MQIIEYRVRPVTRYIVTRWEGDNDPVAKSAASRQIGNEYANAETAYEVGYALCRAEHERLGWPTGDDRIKYPGHPNEEATNLAGVAIGDKFPLNGIPGRNAL